MWNVLRYLWHVHARPAPWTLADTAHDCAATIPFGVDRRSPNVAYQLDGDYGGMLPVDVEVLPGELRLLVSARSGPPAGIRHAGWAVAWIACWRRTNWLQPDERPNFVS